MAGIYIELGALLVVVFLLYLLYRFLKNPLFIIMNSVIGIAVFLLLDYFGMGIPINILSVGIVAIGGITGLIVVVILHVFGLGF